MSCEPTLRERALRLLARREHSRAELAHKLAGHAGPGEDVEQLLDELSRRNLLSEARYVDSRVRQLSRKYGAARIAHELRAKGLSKDAAAAAATAARASELERAREVWRKKFRSLPQTREERARQIRFLQSRGFSFDAIRTVIGGGEEER
jgi:regulatory protein